MLGRTLAATLLINEPGEEIEFTVLDGKGEKKGGQVHGREDMVKLLEMRGRRMRILAGLGILLALDPELSGAEPQRVPGTGVSLEPPEGFSLTKRFPGFSREDLGASIMVTEIPGPISEVKKGMTKEELLRNGIELISSTTEAVSGRESVLFKVRQSADEIVAIKWVLLAGDEKQSLMIMGSFRQDSEAELGDAIRRSILKASWKPRPTAR